jgi:hypothetical protein
VRQALAVARRQQAKSLELRAAMSLSRLWQQQGRPEEARQLLSEVYDWLTEGFETADLQEATRLLETLHKQFNDFSVSGHLGLQSSHSTPCPRTSRLCQCPSRRVRHPRLGRHPSEMPCIARLILLFCVLCAVA